MSIGFVAGKIKICRVTVLAKYCENLAWQYFIGLDMPKSETLAMIKQFEKFPYCPKCGKKINFDEVKNDTCWNENT